MACLALISRHVAGQTIMSLSDKRIPKALSDQLIGDSLGTKLDRNGAISGTFVENEVDTGFNTQNKYTWKIFVNKEGRLEGSIILVSKSKVRGQKEVSLYNKYAVDIEVLFCCATDKDLCVRWSDRKKHPTCKKWKILGTK